MIINYLDAQIKLKMSQKELLIAVRTKQIPYVFSPCGGGIKKAKASILEVDSLERYRADLLAAVSQAEADKSHAALLAFASSKDYQFVLDQSGAYQPAAASLYLLFNCGELVYIGQTTDAVKRRKQHKNMGKKFDTMLILAVPNSIDVVELESRLIAAIKTQYNKCNIAKTYHK